MKLWQRMTSTRKKICRCQAEVARGKLDQSNVSNANGCLRLLLEVEDDEDEAVAAGVGTGAGVNTGGKSQLQQGDAGWLIP